MSSRRSVFIILMALLMIIPGQSKGQYIRASIDTASILVGDPVRYTISLGYPNGFSVNPPVFKDTIVRGVEILSVEGPDTTVGDSMTEVTWTYVVTAFDSAYYIIPPIALLYQLPGDTSRDTMMTQPFLLSAYTLPVDMSKGPVDIKAPFSFPLTLKEILRYAGLALLALLVIGIIIWVIIRLRQGKPIIPFMGPKRLPPHIEALKALEQLRLEGLVAKGEIKEYYTRLSIILRTYIEGQFGLAALESTSFELVSLLKEQGIAQVLHLPLGEFFDRSDLVKFAKGAPLPDEHSRSFKVVEDFIRITMPVEEQEDDKKGGMV